MRKIELDIQKMNSVANLQQHLYEMLNLPRYYGCNLDALHDCLTEMVEKTEIVVPQQVVTEQYLGSYGASLIQVLQDAAEENESLKITVK